MSSLTIDFLEATFTSRKETSLFGKWIRLQDIEKLFKKYEPVFNVSILGYSEFKKPIYQLKIGNGSKKILLWSQMHGNESTGTRALFDLFNCFLGATSKEVQTILDNCSLVFIPMLNPDGAEVYTRVNGNGVDLNRDAVNREAEESKLLRGVLESFHPQFCFNLHDQRTIFNVEGFKNPATISFLAPSEEVSRKITEGRKQTMNVIIAMHTVLQSVIPNCVGRYTDEFYPTATGDNFQKLGYNTILIESGHYPEDYDRELSRKFTFFSLLQGLYYISKTADFSAYKEYFTIPNNGKDFYDVMHRFLDNSEPEAFQYQDEILNDTLVSKLVKIENEELKGKIGHSEIVFESKKR